MIIEEMSDELAKIGLFAEQCTRSCKTVALAFARYMP